MSRDAIATAEKGDSERLTVTSRVKSRGSLCESDT